MKKTSNSWKKTWNSWNHEIHKKKRELHEKKVLGVFPFMSLGGDVGGGIHSAVFWICSIGVHFRENVFEYFFYDQFGL